MCVKFRTRRKEVSVKQAWKITVVFGFNGTCFPAGSPWPRQAGSHTSSIWRNQDWTWTHLISRIAKGKRDRLDYEKFQGAVHKLRNVKNINCSSKIRHRDLTRRQIRIDGAWGAGLRTFPGRYFYVKIYLKASHDKARLENKHLSKSAKKNQEIWLRPVTHYTFFWVGFQVFVFSHHFLITYLGWKKQENPKKLIPKHENLWNFK